MNTYFGLKSRAILTSLTALSLTACIYTSSDTEEMLILSSALTKLSKQVEVEVRYKNPPKDISSNELLKLSTKHDPDILNSFSNYSIQIKKENRHASLLVCTDDLKVGLIEDVACSPHLDAHLWKSIPKKPCQFTLNIKDICTK